VNNAVALDHKQKRSSFKEITLRNLHRPSLREYEGEQFMSKHTTIPELLEFLRKVPAEHLKGIRRIDISNKMKSYPIGHYSDTPNYLEALKREGRTEALILGSYDPDTRVITLTCGLEHPQVECDFEWVVFHEICHHYMNYMDPRILKAYASLVRGHTDMGYGGLNPEESFCEAYAAYLTGGVLIAEVREFMRKIVFKHEENEIMAKSLPVYDDFFKAVNVDRKCTAKLPVKLRESEYPVVQGIEKEWIKDYQSTLLAMAQEILEVVTPQENIDEDEEEEDD